MINNVFIIILFIENFVYIYEIKLKFLLLMKNNIEIICSLVGINLI